MKFTKMHGAGNDYLYIDARNQDDFSPDWSQLSRSMSDRHFGVGSDGIILIEDSGIADLKMRMFNADGSESEMCGTGLRCFAKYAIERGLATPGGDGIEVETLGGIRTVVPIYDGDRITGARVAMGEPLLEPGDVPVILDPASGYPKGPVTGYPLAVDSLELSLSFVSMGNPHAITFIDQPVGEFPLHTIGPMVEHHSIFPNRVNFETVNITGPGAMTARVWERGSGETMACGTGACAIAVAARLLGIADGRVDITLPGGTLSIDWDGEGEVYLEGPAEEIFSGKWPV
ncbi:MAG: diaminopimelate epimerase [Dehalococcoidia bacterium]|nr:diaminopimelate epimerase [Dehalococcoidia bacterium]